MSKDERKVSPDSVEDNIWVDNTVAAGQCDFRWRRVEMVVEKDYQVVSVVHCKELPSRQILDPTKSTPSLYFPAHFCESFLFQQCNSVPIELKFQPKSATIKITYLLVKLN